MVAIRQAGGHTIAESEQTAVVYGMPREAIERGGASRGGAQLRGGGRDRESGSKDDGMSGLTEYMEKLECPDEAERIYAAEDIGYLNAAGGRAGSSRTVGQGAFAGGSRRHIPGPDSDRRGRGDRGFHPACSKTTIRRFATRPWIVLRRKGARVDPLPEHRHARGRQGLEEAGPRCPERSSKPAAPKQSTRPRFPIRTRTW